jgi:hypothetical protein
LNTTNYNSSSFTATNVGKVRIVVGVVWPRGGMRERERKTETLGWDAEVDMDGKMGDAGSDISNSEQRERECYPAAYTLLPGQHHPGNISTAHTTFADPASFYFLGLFFSLLP